MNSLSSHVLDTTLGRPAANLSIRLEQLAPSGGWTTRANRTSNEQGRVMDFGAGAGLEAGVYRLTFETDAYLATVHGQSEPFYPDVIVQFRITASSEHYHIPLLLSPYGYS